MAIENKIDNKPLIQSAIDFIFVLYLSVSFFYERHIVGRVMLLVFCMSVIVLICFKGDIINKEEKYKIVKNPFFGIYMCFLLYCYWHINYSGKVIHTFVASKMFSTLCINFVFFYLIYKYCVIKNDIEDIFKLYIYAVIILFGMLVVKNGGELFSGRMEDGIVNANEVAGFILYGVVFCLYINEKQKSFFYIIMVGIIIFFILLTGSRMGLIGIVICFALYSYIGSGKKKIRNSIFAILVIVSIYYLIMNVGTLYDIVGVRVEAIMHYFKGESYDEASLSVRDGFISLGWEYIKKKPWLGYGIDCFRTLRESYGTYSHNNYIELLFGVGIFGTLLYYVGYIYILLGHINLYRKFKNNISKTFIIILTLQLVLDYTTITYFERYSLLPSIIALAELQKGKYLY